jgi:hypothetical protein
VLVDDRGEIQALFGGVMPCGESQIRGGSWNSSHPPASHRLGECTTDHPPKNPTTTTATQPQQQQRRRRRRRQQQQQRDDKGLSEDQDDKTGSKPAAVRSRIVSAPGQDNCWTSVVPLATAASRRADSGSGSDPSGGE